MKNTLLFLLIFGLVSMLPNRYLAQDTQNTQSEERTYIRIEIKGLACPYCAYGMEKELKKVSGVTDVNIELKTGMAYISTPTTQKPTKESLAKIVNDAGFTAGEIVFQDHAFLK